MVQIFQLEDDRALREILRTALTMHDSEVEIYQTTTSDDAIDYIRANIHTIDLYVLDIRVPGEKDGMGVAEVIRNLGSEAPVIIASAFEKPPKEVMRALNCIWISKPWSLQTLKKLIPLAHRYRESRAV